MNRISAQLSLYPLRQPHLGPAIAAAIDVFRTRGLDVRPGTMSTLIIGESDALLDSLKASFQAVASLGDVVMVVSLSNCCPVSADDRQPS